MGPYETPCACLLYTSCRAERQVEHPPVHEKQHHARKESGVYPVPCHFLVFHSFCAQTRECKGIPVIDPEGGEFSSLFYKKIRSFLDAVETGGTAPVPTSQVLINQAIIDGIVRSAQAGHEIRIEIPNI